MAKGSREKAAGKSRQSNGSSDSPKSSSKSARSKHSLSRNSAFMEVSSGHRRAPSSGLQTPSGYTQASIKQCDKTAAQLIKVQEESFNEWLQVYKSFSGNKGLTFRSEMLLLDSDSRSHGGKEAAAPHEVHFNGDLFKELMARL